MADELVLASGVAFFNEDFQALPKVVEVLLTKSAKSNVILDDLKADLLAVDHALSLLLFNSTQTSDELLKSSRTLVALGSEIEANKAALRDVHRRISNSIATLSGKRRDLNAASFRKTQIESGLEMLLRLQQCLVAKTPQELALAREICDKHGFQIELQTENTSLELKSEIFALLQSKDGFAQMRMLLQDLFQLAPNEHARMVEEIESFVLASAPRPAVAVGGNNQHSAAALARLAKNELKYITLFPDMSQCEHAVGWVAGLIEWGDWVMQLRALLPNVNAESVVGKTAQRILAALFYDKQVDAGRQEEEELSAYYCGNLSERAALEGDVLPTIRQPSAYFLSLFACEAFAFAQRHHLPQVLAMLTQVHTTALRELVHREASLVSPSSLQTASQCFESFHSLRGLAKELDLMVFSQIDPFASLVAEDKSVLKQVFDPFLQLVVNELGGSNAEEEEVSGLIKQDPLYQALIRENVGTMANRNVLIDASWEYFSSTDQGQPRVDDALLLVPKIPILLALHNCFSPHEDLKAWGDLALFKARRAIRAAVDKDMDDLPALDLIIRQTLYVTEFWVKSRAVLDFLLLPAYFAVSQHYAKRVQADVVGLEDLFSIQSAFQPIVNANEVGDALVFARKLRQCRDEKRRAFWRSKLEQSACFRFLFTPQDVEELCKN